MFFSSMYVYLSMTIFIASTQSSTHERHYHYLEDSTHVNDKKQHADGNKPPQKLLFLTTSFAGFLRKFVISSFPRDDLTFFRRPRPSRFGLRIRPKKGKKDPSLPSSAESLPPTGFSRSNPRKWCHAGAPTVFKTRASLGIGVCAG